MLQEIKNLIKEKIQEKYNISIKEILLEKPPKENLWDFSFACFVLSKQLKQNPNIIANDLAKLLPWWNLIKQTNTVWPYLNIKLSNTLYTKIFNKTYENITKNTYFPEKNKKNIVVDYIWPNIWKPLHIWHMCCPNIWQTIINLYKKLWYNVISDTHLWDWWIIFWKLITAYKLWWNENKLKENAVKHLLELYVKITEESEKDKNLEQKFRDEFKLLSLGDKESVELWKTFTLYSIDAMQIQLDRLNIKADYNIWESFYEWIWLPKLWDYPDLEYDMKSIVLELIDKKIATKNKDNSVWIIFDEKSGIPSCILQKRDETHWYLASDLSCMKYRMNNWNPDKIIFCTDVRQQLHFKQLFAISNKAWWLDKNPHIPESWKTQLIHAHNWFISLKDGAMSSRKWRIIKLDKLLDEAEKRAKNIILEKRNDITWLKLEELSKIIGLWAIKYGYLKKSRDTDIIFDWDEFISFEWNSWPYIQYSYVRAKKILKIYGKKFDQDKIENNLLEDQKEIELIKLICDYKNILFEVTDDHMPHILCKYVYELTKKFNSFYNSVHILNEADENKKNARLKLIFIFSFILKDVFWILGIDMPEEM